MKRLVRIWLTAPALIGAWSTSAVIIPRWLLTVKYLCLAILGLVTIATPPEPLAAFTDSRLVTSLFGLGLFLSAAAAAIGSLSARRRLESLERVASVVLMSLFCIYELAPIVLIVARGQTDLAAYAVIAPALSIVPLARMLTLLRSTGSAAAHADE